MSVLSIAPYFPFRRIKIVEQTVLSNANEARIKVEPDKRFQPICHFCGLRDAPKIIRFYPSASEYRFSDAICSPR